MVVTKYITTMNTWHSLELLKGVYAIACLQRIKFDGLNVAQNKIDVTFINGDNMCIQDQHVF